MGVLGGEDVVLPNHSVECKSVQRCVVFKWMAQCERNNTRKKTPLVIIHQKGTHHETSDLVVMKLSEFKEALNKMDALEHHLNRIIRSEHDPTKTRKTNSSTRGDV